MTEKVTSGKADLSSSWDDTGMYGEYMELQELYLTDGKVDEADNLIWKTVLRTGAWRYRPGPSQKPIPKPLTVVSGKSTDHRSVIGMQDIIESFDKNAIEHVTIPLSHNDKVDENTGWVRKLKIEEDPDKEGEHILRAGLEFTESDIKTKVENGSIANTSIGLFYDYIRKDDGHKFDVAMKHIALTNSPWINGMKPFGMSEEEDVEVSTLEFATEVPEIKTGIPLYIANSGTTNNYVTYTSTTTGTTLSEPIQTVLKTDEGSNGSTTVKQPKRTELSELQKAQRSREIRLSNDNVTKETIMSDVTGLEGLELSDEVRETVTALFAQQQKDLAELRETNRKKDVEARVDELKGLGLSEHPGLLKQIRRFLLADDGGVAGIALSEDGKEEQVTVTDVVEGLISSLPTKDGKINFGEMAESLGVDGDKPPADAAGENKSAEDRYKDASEFLYGATKK